MEPNLANALCQTLLRHGSGEDAITQLQVSRSAFRNAYYAIDAKIPGLTIDFDKLIEGDPIECDPLVSQGNLAILRLDDLYREAYQAWRKGFEGQDQHSHKRVIQPGSTAQRSDKSEKTELSSKQTLPDASLLGQAVNIVLSAFRVQATITHRRDQLKNPQSSRETSSREALANASLARRASEGQPAQRNENSSPTEVHSEIITPDEIHQIDDLTADLTPFKSLAPFSTFKPIKSLSTKIAPIGDLSEAPAPQPCTPATCIPAANSAPPREPQFPVAAQNEALQEPEPEPYFPVPPYENISYQSAEVHALLAAFGQEATFSDSS